MSKYIDYLRSKLFHIAACWYNDDETVYMPVAWIRNDETGELIVYTRGAHADQIIKFVEAL